MTLLRKTLSKTVDASMAKSEVYFTSTSIQIRSPTLINPALDGYCNLVPRVLSYPVENPGSEVVDLYDIDRFRHPPSEIVKRLYVYSDFFIFVLYFNGFGFYNRKKKDVALNVTHYFSAAKICFGVTR